MKRYSLGSSSVSALEKKYVNEVLDRNFLSPGPVVAEVEKMCAEMHGMAHCVTLNSGQSAIQVGLQALITRIAELNPTRDFGQRPPLVAVPACTYISTLAAAIYAGCDLVLVDVELPSGNMCPEQLDKILWYQRQVGDPVDIVIPVHLYGKACHESIQVICKQYDVLVLEDACEATTVPGVGWGHILTTSFFSNHLISGGSGGAIMTNDPDIDLYCWKLINHGRSSRFNNDDIHRIADKFRFDVWGHSLKWNDVSAAIVKAQLERKDELYAARRNNAYKLYVWLWLLKADHGKIWLPQDENNNHCFMMYPIVLDESIDVPSVIRRLNDSGIETRRMMPITDQPVVKGYFGGNLKTDFPNADLLNRQGFYVGTHPELSEVDMDGMGKIISTVISEEMGINGSS